MEVAKKQASLMADLAVALASTKVKGLVVLFPNGLPSPRQGRYAAFNGKELVAQDDSVRKVERKAARKGKAATIVIDVAFDYSQQCFF